MDSPTAIFEQHRGMLQGLAYRMTGALADAEDLVQDTYLKWTTANHQEIQNPRSWLMTACSRQALDWLKSARVQRERYCGVWLPEPYHPADEADPATQADIDDTVSIALMLALEKLSPSERAAFLLHEVFGCPFDEIAAMLGKSSAACRKLASRARSLVQSAKPRFQATANDHQRLLDAFLRAAYAGNLDELKSILAESVELHSDGGGKADASAEVLLGPSTVARFMIGVLHYRPSARNDCRISSIRFNGGPGIAIFESGALVTALSLAIHEGTIHRVFAVRNPDKLTVLSAQIAAGQ